MVIKMEGKTKRKITCNISLVITIIGLLILITGTSYAALIGNTSSSSEQIIRAGGVTLTLTENYESINKKIIVLEDADGLLQEDVYEFNIKNTGSIAVRYDIKIINELSGENVLPLEYIKVGLEINGEEYGPFNLGEEEGIIDSGVIYKKEIINYSLRIWLDKDKEEEIEEIEGKMANLKIVVEAEQRPNSMDKGESKEFSYTGNYEEYIVPRDGWYYIELGGAQGGSSYIEGNGTYDGGLGAKTSGYIELEAGEKLYFYVGGKGKRCVCSTSNTCCGENGGYNGGGKTLQYTGGNTYYGSGGGATDVRLVGGTWDNTTSLISRIMVAAGGGGGSNWQGSSTAGYNYIGGSGGTLYGNIGYYTRTDRTNTCTGGTQISGGDGTYSAGSGLGEGAYPSSKYGPGGGGGYYGGGTSETNSCGGSSYISGYAGVNSVEESTTITHTNQTLHYSGKYFIGGSMISNANSGEGYAKIVYIDTKPKKKNTNLNNVRYIRNCTNYNSRNNDNHWIEVQAMVDGVNIAKGKAVVGTADEYSNRPYSRITDGDITYTNYSYSLSPTLNQCITVDLGSTYDLDEVAVWNYFGDQRSYYDNVTYVSSNNSTWREVINEASIETSNGHRVNAYTDTYNGYIQDSLVLWYDGYANTGTTRDQTSTTWKDLSGTGNDVTISGGTWYNNYLYFDGVDDYAYKTSGAVYNIDKEHTIEVLLKPGKVDADTWQVIFNTVNTGAGVLQYGGLWINKQNTIYYEIADGVANNITQGFTLTSSNIGEYVLLTNIRDDKHYKTYNKASLYDDRMVTWNARTPNDAIYIGSISTGYFFQGEIYSIRVYNRALTVEEVLHNYLYDEQNFKLD